MNKIAVVMSLIIILSAFYWYSRMPSHAEQICIGSGGTVTTSSCCKSASDFPNLCLIGACGCSPENSHNVKICECGEGRCFDGEKCTDI